MLEEGERMLESSASNVGRACLRAHGQGLNPQPAGQLENVTPHLWPVEFLESLGLRAGWAPGAILVTDTQLPFIFHHKLGLAGDTWPLGNLT